MIPDATIARRNAVLAGLDDATLEQLSAHLEEVKLPRGQVLYDRGSPIGHVHFITSGMVSLVHEFSGGEIVEIASVGREGVSGISVFLAATGPAERAMVQISGTALRMSASSFLVQLDIIGQPLREMLGRYTQAMITQLGRNAACNRVHRLHQRAARWLMMCADRADGPSFDLTQEFLAQMLAVRRASVSEIAQVLADEGSISYTRGTITILDREKLHDNACECYDIITQTTREAVRTE